MGKNAEYTKALITLSKDATRAINACVKAAQHAAEKTNEVFATLLVLIEWGLVSDCTRAEWRAAYGLLLDRYRLIEGAIDVNGRWERGFWSSLSQYAAYGSSLVYASMIHYDQDVLVPENMNELRSMYKDLLNSRKQDAKPGKPKVKKTDLVKRLSKDKQIQALFDSLVKYSESHSRKQTLIVVQSLQKRLATIANTVIDGSVVVTASVSRNANN